MDDELPPLFTGRNLRRAALRAGLMASLPAGFMVLVVITGGLQTAARVVLPFVFAMLSLAPIAMIELDAERRPSGRLRHALAGLLTWVAVAVCFGAAGAAASYTQGAVGGGIGGGMQALQQYVSGVDDTVFFLALWVFASFPYGLLAFCRLEHIRENLLARDVLGAFAFVMLAFAAFLWLASDMPPDSYFWPLTTYFFAALAHLVMLAALFHLAEQLEPKLVRMLYGREPTSP